MPLLKDSIVKTGNRQGLALSETDLENYPQYTMADNGRGYVYLLEARNGLIKIGQTVNLPLRMKRHRRIWKGEFDFIIIGIIPSDDCYRLEAALHRKYVQHRETRKVKWVSSWFALSAGDVTYIKSL